MGKNPGENEKMQAAILAGGAGTRLRPLTHKVPKPLVLINNKPFLEYQIRMLRKNSIRDIVLCVGYLWGQFKDYFGSGAKLGVKIKYSIEKNLLGTGGALENARKYLHDRFFVIYGDSYLPINYRKVWSFFSKSDKLALLVVYDNRKNTAVKNNIALDEKTWDIIEYNKGGKGKNLNYVDAGVLLLKKAALDLIPKNRISSLEKEIFPVLIKREQFIAFKTNQRFYDIGTPKRLKIIKKILRQC